MNEGAETLVMELLEGKDEFNEVLDKHLFSDEVLERLLATHNLQMTDLDLTGEECCINDIP